ncbi:Cytochrome P450 18a1 [Nymphon striatum]|nr:Cytochrome P450 18a1 [Nymphon striatum]
MDTIIVLVAIAAVILIKVLMKYIENLKKYEKLPPGPRGLPIFGNLFSLMEEPGKGVMKLAEKFGSIMKIYIGNNPMVIVSDFHQIKELMKMKGVHGRPTNGIYQDFSKGLGIGMSNGELWQANRALVLRHFHDSGKTNIEAAVRDELVHVASHLEKYCEEEEPIELASIILRSSCNITFELCFGKRFSYDDKDLLDCAKAMENSFALIAKAEVLSSFRPWSLPFTYFMDKTVVGGFDKVRVLSQKMVDEVKNLAVKQEKYNKDTKDQNFINRYLSVMDNSKDSKDKQNVFFDEQLYEVITDLFAAGTETTTTFVRWSVLYLLENKDVAKKMQAEMDSVIGRSAVPELRHQTLLPYTMATIYELERITSFVPLAPYHTNDETLEWKGYVIPKKTVITYSIWGVHFDPKLWKDPENFNPLRFINKEGEAVRPEYLISFGIGRRMCVGKSLAEVEMFLYVSTLFHLFDFQAVPGEPTTETLPISGLTRRPQEYKVRVKKRPFFG